MSRKASIAELQKQLAEEEYKLCEQSFMYFVKKAWQYIDTQPFIDSWHISCIVDHCQAQYEGEQQLRKLCINIQPRLGKCLALDTRIQLADSSFKDIKDIEIGDKVLSSNGNSVVTDEVVAKVFSGKKDVYKITLTNGMSIEGSLDHRLGGWKEFKSIKDLRIEDTLTICKNLSHINNTDKISKDDAFIMALYLAEGSKSEKQGLTITNLGLEIRQKSIEIANKYNWGINFYDNGKTYTFRSDRVLEYKDATYLSPRRYLKKYNLKEHNTYNIRVPQIIFQSSNEVIKEFLSTYISCDGWVTQKNNRNSITVGICSASEKMIEDLQLLCLRLNIKTSKVYKQTTYTGADKMFDSWTLSICDYDSLKIIRDTFYIYDKQYKTTNLKDVEYTCNVSVPPEFKYDLIKSQLWHRQNYETISKVKHAWLDSNKAIRIVDREDNLILKEKLTKGLGWDSIKKIEYMGTKDTYDIETKEYNCFFANGILSHNSKIVSVLYPCWMWLRNPQEEVFTASHSMDLIYQFTMNARDLLQHSWFKDYWCDTKNLFQLSDHQNTKRQFNNTVGGKRIGTSVGSKVLGKGGSAFLLDDLNSREEALSNTALQKVNDFYLGTLKNRTNIANPIWLNIQQRIAHLDFSGWLKENENDWYFLVIPTEYTKHFDMKTNPIGWEDPRTTEGELICPARFPEEYYYSIKKDPLIFSSMYQQVPVTLGGNVIKESWIKFYDNEIATDFFDEIIISVDLAIEATEEADYSVFSVIGKKDNNLYLIDLVRDKLEFADQVSSLLALVKNYTGATVLIEMKANGNALYDTLKRLIPRVIASTPSNQMSKLQRIYATIPSYIAGNIYMPSVKLKHWMTDVLEEILSYPKGRWDDCIDTITQAINYSVTYSPESSTYIPKTKSNLYTSTVQDLTIPIRYGITEKRTNIWR